MNPKDRKAAKDVYRAYVIAREAHMQHLHNDVAYREWSAAYAKWVKTMRDTRMSRFEREDIHNEVTAELTAIQ